MSKKPTSIVTPVGRLVAGSLWEPNTTDAEGNPLVIKHGPNAGQPRVEYYIGLAVPKSSPDWNEFYQKIVGEARASFPSLFDANGNCISPKFAFKITDGDSQVPNSRGTKPADREGYAGHWIVNLSSGFAPKCYVNNNGEYSQVLVPEDIKKGYYIRVAGTVAGNGSQQQPGVFLNLNMVERVAYGEEIISGPRAEDVFGSAPAAKIPEGASATPVAPSTPMPGTGAATPPPAAPSAPVQPAPDFLNPPAPSAPPAPPAAPKMYDVGGQKFTREQLLGGGWSEDDISKLG